MKLDKLEIATLVTLALLIGLVLFNWITYGTPQY